MKRTSSQCILAASILLVACSGDEPIGEQREHATAIPTAAIRFDASWNETVNGPLVAGGQLLVDYDPQRLATCEGYDQGFLAWAVRGHARINGAETTSFDILSNNRREAGPVRLPLPHAGDLELWFETNDKWGCHEWDSNYGNNYHFTVGHLDTLPSWAGQTRHLISRCGPGCAGDFRDLEEDFYFGTWARQRAAVTWATFEAWEPGVTDWDNPDIWQQLDARIHYRFGSSGSFESAFVDHQSRQGNNARYAFDLRSLDPLGYGTITEAWQCPSVPLRRDGSYVVTTLELYFSIGDLEIRPAPGEVFTGTFADYTDLYDICVVD